MENTRPGNHDRAWNDPPLFDYNTTPGGTGKSSGGTTKLNKRIGFPPSSQPTNDTSKPPSNPSLPPPALPPPAGAAAAAKESKSSDESKEASISTTDVKLEDVIRKLETSLIAAEESGRIDAKKASEIRKRIGMLEDKWSRNQLNEKLHHGMFRLTACIAEDNFDEAEKIQRSLNVDYPNLCTPWMIAIRQLILAQQEKKGQ